MDWIYLIARNYLHICRIVNANTCFLKVHSLLRDVGHARELAVIEN